MTAIPTAGIHLKEVNMSSSSNLLRLLAVSCLTAGALLPEQAVTPADLRANSTETAKKAAVQEPQSVAPPAVPAGPERVANYILGAEDQIIVHAYQVPEVPGTAIQVDGDGYINLPFAGRVKASGLSVSALERELATRFGNYVRDPQVTVLVADYRSQPVSVVGAVNAPGVVQLRGRKNLVEVIALAGGLRPDAGNTVTLTRELSKGAIPLPDAQQDATGRFSVAHVKLHDVMESQNPKDNIVIEANDLITIPKAPLLYVVGEVQKPGGYVLTERDSMTVLQAVALAGGLTQLASPKHAKILHQNATLTSQNETPTDVSKILAGRAPDVMLHTDDILFVPNSTSKSVGAKALQTAINMAGVAVWKF
jgi:polysaccharide biosynthesis/export protein